jgi:hypothetical protein
VLTLTHVDYNRRTAPHNLGLSFNLRLVLDHCLIIILLFYSISYVLMNFMYLIYLLRFDYEILVFRLDYYTNMLMKSPR